MPIYFSSLGVEQDSIAATEKKHITLLQNKFVLKKRFIVFIAKGFIKVKRFLPANAVNNNHSKA
jgi:hypothetical protein